MVGWPWWGDPAESRRGLMRNQIGPSAFRFRVLVIWRHAATMPYPAGRRREGNGVVVRFNERNKACKSCNDSTQPQQSSERRRRRSLSSNDDGPCRKSSCPPVVGRTVRRSARLLVVPTHWLVRLMPNKDDQGGKHRINALPTSGELKSDPFLLFRAKDKASTEVDRRSFA
jgi:hypothetical protein